MDAKSDTKTWNNVLSLAKSEGCVILDAKSRIGLNIGGALLRFVQPSKDYTDTNEDSIVTYLDYNNAEFLFTGDIEAITEKDMLSQGLVPNVDFMSVPHHGSRGSSTSEFVTAADPEYAIVSVGQNSYGHPTVDALSKYSAIGAKVYRTDQLGNIVIKTDGNQATINGSSVSISGISTTNPNLAPSALQDIKGHWSESSIRDFVSKGYVGGYSDGRFKPNTKITRAEAVSTLSRVHQGEVPPVVNTPVPTQPVTQPKPPVNNEGSNLTGNTTVFVTPSGKSYHSTKSCTTLKRSKKILSVTLNQAKSQGKSDPCNICVR